MFPADALWSRVLKTLEQNACHFEIKVKQSGLIKNRLNSESYDFAVQERGVEARCLMQICNYREVFLTSLPHLGIKSHNRVARCCHTRSTGVLRLLRMLILRARLQICNLFRLKKAGFFAFVAFLRPLGFVPNFPKRFIFVQTMDSLYF